MYIWRRSCLLQTSGAALEARAFGGDGHHAEHSRTLVPAEPGSRTGTGGRLLHGEFLAATEAGAPSRPEGMLQVSHRGQTPPGIDQLTQAGFGMEQGVNVLRLWAEKRPCKYEEVMNLILL